MNTNSLHTLLAAISTVAEHSTEIDILVEHEQFICDCLNEWSRDYGATWSKLLSVGEFCRWAAYIIEHDIDCSVNPIRLEGGSIYADTDGIEVVCIDGCYKVIAKIWFSPKSNYEEYCLLHAEA